MKKVEQKLPYTLLTKHFANQTSAEEAEVVKQWRELSPDNEHLYRELQDEWTVIHPDPASFVMLDTDKVWNNVMHQINKSIKPVLYTRQFLYRMMAVAATVALLVGLSVSLLTNSLHKSGEMLAAESVYIVPTGQKSQLVLPDGSKVWMNSGSKLTYTTDFSKTQREVQLEGEAFFDVEHDEAHKFVVNAGLVNVVVHGTAFSVSNYKNDATVSVVLVRGSVSLETSSEHKLLANLLPGQKADVMKSDEKCVLSAFDMDAHNVWMLNQLQFKGEPVRDVFKKVERWYGVKVQLINEDPLYCYWLTLKTESLTEMLNLINKITPIDYTINGEEVTIRYKR